ncbi:hypothetical protein GGX14DRAFT_391789 [Mycena pura]|uniref:Uncharacterized protein n=1 Tax=Mycena pura TaxID=153505 RepID=A0AAD6YG39_9AGAR|nr:hypothetical protein GGX14DRAFT_391789 [Mycena pura]
MRPFGAVAHHMWPYMVIAHRICIIYCIGAPKLNMILGYTHSESFWRALYLTRWAVTDSTGHRAGDQRSRFRHGLALSSDLQACWTLRSSEKRHQGRRIDDSDSDAARASNPVKRKRMKASKGARKPQKRVRTDPVPPMRRVPAGRTPRGVPARGVGAQSVQSMTLLFEGKTRRRILSLGLVFAPRECAHHVSFTCERAPLATTRPMLTFSALSCPNAPSPGIVHHLLMMWMAVATAAFHYAPGHRLSSRGVKFSESAPAASARVAPLSTVLAAVCRNGMTRNSILMRGAIRCLTLSSCALGCVGLAAAASPCGTYRRHPVLALQEQYSLRDCTHERQRALPPVQIRRRHLPRAVIVNIYIYSYIFKSGMLLILAHIVHSSMSHVMRAILDVPRAVFEPRVIEGSNVIVCSDSLRPERFREVGLYGWSFLWYNDMVETFEDPEDPKAVSIIQHWNTFDGGIWTRRWSPDHEDAQHRRPGPNIDSPTPSKATSPRKPLAPLVNDTIDTIDLDSDSALDEDTTFASSISRASASRPYDDELLPSPAKRARTSTHATPPDDDEKKTTAAHNRCRSGGSGGCRSRTAETGSAIANGLKTIGTGMSAPLITKADTSHVDEVINVLVTDETILPHGELYAVILELLSSNQNCS